MEDMKDEFSVNEYSISQTSLEKIFNKFANEQQSKNSDFHDFDVSQSPRRPTTPNKIQMELVGNINSVNQNDLYNGNENQILNINYPRSHAAHAVKRSKIDVSEEFLK